MKAFAIENETNNITIHDSVKEAEAVPNTERFSNEAALARLAANWPAARLVEIWNSLPGETPVRKFKDRSSAVSRIWRAIQRLSEFEPIAEEAPGPAIEEMAPVAEPVEAAPVPESKTSETAQPEAGVPESPEATVAAPVAPQPPDVAPEEAPSTKIATRAKKAPVAADAKEAGAPREGSKTSELIEMLKRADGATLEQICTKFGWLPHTVRAMMSGGGSLAKKHRLTVTSEKAGGERRYWIKG